MIRKIEGTKYHLRTEVTAGGEGVTNVSVHLVKSFDVLLNSKTTNAEQSSSFSIHKSIHGVELVKKYFKETIISLIGREEGVSSFASDFTEIAEKIVNSVFATEKLQGHSSFKNMKTGSYNDGSE